MLGCRQYSSLVLCLITGDLFCSLGQSVGDGRPLIILNQLEVLELLFRPAAEQCSALTSPRLSGRKDRVCYGRCIMLAATYERAVEAALRVYSRVTKVLAPWLNLIVQLGSSQPPLMVPKAEMLSQETESSNFYSSPLIEAEEDIQSGKLGAFLSYHSV